MMNPLTMSATLSITIAHSTNKNTSTSPLPDPTTKITPTPLLIHTYSKTPNNKQSGLESYPKKYKLQPFNPIIKHHIRNVSSMTLSPKLKKYNIKKSSKLNLHIKPFSSQMTL